MLRRVRIRDLTLAACCGGVLLGAGCRMAGLNARDSRRPIKQVFCLYDQKPWLNLDAEGDRDPEGLGFRVFLDSGKGLGVRRKGKFYVQMYEIRRSAEGNLERKLVSDWHLPTDELVLVKSRVLGYGYHLKLRWATKDIPGNEIEIITSFEDKYGRVTRSGTKRLVVPRYDT